MWEHLEDLRWVIVKSALAFILAAGLIVSFLPDLTALLRWPLDVAMGSPERSMEVLRTRSPFDVFSVIIQVIFLGGLALSLPFILYFVTGFVLPGLTRRERRAVLPVLFLAMLSFLGGAAFSFGVVLPAALKASVYFNEMLGFQEIWSPSDYYALVVWGSLLSGLVFELPLLVTVLVYLELLETRVMTDNWRAIFVVILIAAALISPGGDPVSFLFVAAPLLVLYGLAILGGQAVERRRRRDEG